jgi:hypothetical protein
VRQDFLLEFLLLWLTQASGESLLDERQAGEDRRCDCGPIWRGRREFQRIALQKAMQALLI